MRVFFSEVERLLACTADLLNAVLKLQAATGDGRSAAIGFCALAPQFRAFTWNASIAANTGKKNANREHGVENIVNRNTDLNDSSL